MKKENVINCAVAAQLTVTMMLQSEVEQRERKWLFIQMVTDV